MRRWTSCFCVGLLLLLAPVALAGKKEARREAKAQEKREKIDAMAKQTLDRLFEESEQARHLYDKAAGYAVFDNTKVALVVSGGGGGGVAVDKTTGERTYMKMGMAGIGLGLGAQVYQVVFLFETEEVLRNFVDKGWAAESAANAVAGTAGANAEASFADGMALYQLTQGGLMLQADISGTKYWKNKRLNAPEKQEEDKK
ncbi:MAG: YSC84-related protein [Acidobacteriota bacterium]